MVFRMYQVDGVLLCPGNEEGCMLTWQSVNTLLCTEYGDGVHGAISIGAPLDTLGACVTPIFIF